MRKLILMAGIAVIGTASPLLAQHQSKGHGNGHGEGSGGRMSEMMDHQGDGTDRGERDEQDSLRSGYARHDDERRIKRNQHAGYGGGFCPPGLAKKSPACMPPGQAKRLFNEGQRVPFGYRYYSPYNSIPRQYRSNVPYDAANRYIYRNNQVYVVNPQTRLVEQIINLLR